MTQPADPSHAPPTPPPHQPSRAATALDWDTVTRTGIVRDRQSGWISGTCSGIAARYDVDPLLIRAAAVALTFTGGLGVPLYLAAWLLLPDTSGRVLLREAGSGAGTPLLLVAAFVLSLVVGLGFSTQNGTLGLPSGLLALVVAAALVLHGRRRRPGPGAPAPPQSAPPAPTGWPTTGMDGVPPGPPAAWPAAGTSAAAAGTSAAAAGTSAAAGGTYAAAPAWPLPEATSRPPTHPVTWTYAPTSSPTTQRNAPWAPPSGPLPTPPPGGTRVRPRPAPRGSGAVAFVLTLAAFWGVTLTAPRWGIVEAPWVFGLLAALAVASLCALLLGMFGRRGGLATALTLMLIVPAIIAVPLSRIVPSVNDVARQDWTPTLAGQSREVGVSDVRVDLSSLPIDATGAALRLSVAAGTVTVDVPADRAVVISMRVGGGDLDAGPYAPTGESRIIDGVGAERTIAITPAGTEARAPVRLEVEVGLGSIVLRPATTSTPSPRSTS